MQSSTLGLDVDWEWLVTALRKSIDGGCHIPTIRPTYTASCRIQMPRVLTEAEKTYLQVELELLPCNCTFELTPNGQGETMYAFAVYQGG